MKAIILHTIRAAKRDMLFRGSIIAIILATAFGFFMGSNALSETNEMKIVYSASMARMIVIFCIMIFVCFHIKRMFENREIEMMITKPVSRAKIVIGFFIGFCALLLPISFVVLMALFKLSNKLGLAMWMVSFILETVAVVSLSMFFALLIESPVFSLMMSACVYLLSRIIGSFIAYISIADSARGWNSLAGVSELLIKITSTVLPRFDFCAKTAWLIGNIDYKVFAMGAAQCIIYSALLIFANIFDFERKSF